MCVVFTTSGTICLGLDVNLRRLLTCERGHPDSHQVRVRMCVRALNRKRDVGAWLQKERCWRLAHIRKGIMPDTRGVGIAPRMGCGNRPSNSFRLRQDSLNVGWTPGADEHHPMLNIAGQLSRNRCVEQGNIIGLKGGSEFN